MFYAAATLGAVTVPVNTRFKSAELAFCLAQADVKALFLADRFLNIDFLSFLRAAEPAVDRALPGAVLPLLRHVLVIGDQIPAAGRSWNDFLALGAGVSDGELDRLAADVRPRDLLLIQFTSGTTPIRRPMLTRQHAAQRLGGRPAAGDQADDHYSTAGRSSTSPGTTLSLLVSLIAGACLVILPTFEAGAALR